MGYFPLFLDTKSSRFLIIGAGSVALSKLNSILEFSSNVGVVSREFSVEMLEVLEAKKVNFIQDSYQKKYLAGYDVIIAATNDQKLNAQIADQSRLFGKLVNVVDAPEISDFIFGANIVRDNVVVSVGTFGTSPVLARLIKNRILSALPQNLSGISKFLSKNKQRVREFFKDITPRRLFLQDLLEGEAGDQLEAGNEVKAQQIFDDKLAEAKNQNDGAVYFIGAGPGDEELITLKAIKLLSRADVVLHDRLVGSKILDYARKDALKVNVGKVRDLHRYSQQEINELLVKYTKEGKIVARLKGGDVAIFAHLSEEIEAIAKFDINYQIVPGVSSANAAAASIGASLTSRQSAHGVRYITIYKNELRDVAYWQDLAKTKDTLVLYMSSHNVTTIANNLLTHGKDSKTPLVLIEQASTPYQKNHFSTISQAAKEFKDKKFASPTLLLIGEAISPENVNQWREESLLEGQYFGILTPKKEAKYGY